ncbi:glycosyltransferase family 58 protein [Basidiobolus meristosporus CBS 931.73]|uniref:Dol-P-Man:Man(5)GlcNAc(2)-PP-Dol alpha-1,3-mannosyltransferase n=1 Tax=Basidiobolus meristosporus CBS 931.73 TaxID=1314790 RepID=A0A1Y1YLH0_9FUNG|nr:glycosyltransferase family 58 protein [Basidiobolus meristosporus CBS 931.73]|eukprot:ORX98842.1 glycosyltransferase family 58 protein [Basidiobolus meristosporus CBS 931.73]
MSKCCSLVRNLLLDRRYFPWLALGLVLGELLLNVLIIKKVAYTEIDWIAYMQEVQGFLGGELDYVKLRGDTGPLVYPAGFVYIYSGLYYLTGHGQNILLAQMCFAGLYMSTLLIVLRIYYKIEKMPPYVVILLCCSRRLHSIYTLRLFNDPVAMVFLYLAVLLLIERRWKLACILYSFAVSIKMNVLLFLPGLALVLFKVMGAYRAVIHLLLCVVFQLVLGFPFLQHNALSYVSRAFEFSRVFTYIWTVNWKFVPEDVFLGKEFATTLLVAHLVTLLLFLVVKWTREEQGLFRMLAQGLRWNTMTKKMTVLSPDHICELLFVSNFIGIVFSRTLHYQFYSWYYHTLPYLLWKSRLSLINRFLMIGAIEYCWNVFPATFYSSLLLQVCHIVLLSSLFLSSVDLSSRKKTNKRQK